MLNRESVSFTCREASRLINGPKFQNSRTLRRFLESAYPGEFYIQLFAFNEGYSKAQLESIREYAELKVLEQAFETEELGFVCHGTMTDEVFGSVSNVYKAPFDIKSATLKQLQVAVKMVYLMNAYLESFAYNPSREAGFEDYQYRNLPCSIESRGDLWEISGFDKRTGGAGVLEWCYDEADAKELYDQMARFPERFEGLTFSRHQSGPGMNRAVAQSLGLAAA